MKKDIWKALCCVGLYIVGISGALLVGATILHVFGPPVITRDAPLLPQVILFQWHETFNSIIPWITVITITVEAFLLSCLADQKLNKRKELNGA